MRAQELKELYGIDDNIHVIGFTDDEQDWYHVHDDEEVPEIWAFKIAKPIDVTKQVRKICNSYKKEVTEAIKKCK